MAIKFRTLRADEIDCRVNTVSEKGLSLLLYKDARCDMNILDETVDPENWQRRHIRDNANCIVSIYDDSKGIWIEKEDTGSESNSEKQKGLASDSFKRACVNWGIGRELYTSPFIWIPNDKCVIQKSGKEDKYGKPAYTCKDKFHVSLIEYDDHRNISKLQIKKTKSNMVVYSYNAGQVPLLVDDIKLGVIFAEMERTGVTSNTLCAAYQVNRLGELTMEEAASVLNRLKKTKDKG